MTPPPTIHDLRRTLGLTTGGVARILGVDRRTVQRWIDGTREMPEPAYRLLRLLASLSDGVVRLRRLIGSE
jgi:DNA-binding transcriptional regulator YiaG